jgi:hypothetical protein
MEEHMKKSAIVIALLLMTAAVAQAAPTVKAHMMVGPYIGYSLGFGDAFKDYEDEFSKFSSNAGLNFGGSFHYGLTDKMMLGGELFVQQYKFEYEDKTGSPFTPNYDVSESETNILGSLLYTMSYMQKAVFMLNAGAGIYGQGSGSELGIFGGIMYNYMIARTIMLAFMPRIHFIMADETVMLLQLSVAIHWWLGQTGTPIDAM